MWIQQPGTPALMSSRSSDFYFLIFHVFVTGQSMFPIITSWLCCCSHYGCVGNTQCSLHSPKQGEPLICLLLFSEEKRVHLGWEALATSFRVKGRLDWSRGGCDYDLILFFGISPLTLFFPFFSFLFFGSCLRIKPNMGLPSVLPSFFFPPLYPRLQHRPLVDPVRQDKPFLPGSTSETLSVREKVSNSPCLPISVMGEDILIHLQYSSGDISSAMPNSNGQELIWTF